MGKLVFDKKGLKTVDDKMRRALELSAHVMRDEIRNEGVIPMREGTLRGEAMYIDTSRSKEGIVRIGHNTPYARRLYYHPEYHFNKAFAPNAQAYWFSFWLKGGIYEKRFAEVYAALLDKEI